MTSMTTRPDAGSDARRHCPDLRACGFVPPAALSTAAAGLSCCPAPRVGLVFGECWSRREWAVCRVCGQTTQLVEAGK